MGSLLFFVVSRSCLSIIDNMEWRVETLLKVATRVGIVSSCDCNFAFDESTCATKFSVTIQTSSATD
eukprot:SAG31_NODE_5195_length_2684_cov_2.509865_2_plen_67_part_00